MRYKLWAICNTVNYNKRESTRDWRDIKPNIVKAKKTGNSKGNTNQLKGVKKPQLDNPEDGQIQIWSKYLRTMCTIKQKCVHVRNQIAKKLCVNVHDHRTHILITSNELGRQHESRSTHLQLSPSKHQKLKDKLSFLII